jgi:alkanesulfonate monooxygenase SsuD/methylene tetrahydromethanopterin reductase-like flavin-dependent oxidoreductase (luciferase family)
MVEPCAAGRVDGIQLPGHAGHFGPRFAPGPALALAAQATRRLRVGSLVYDNDFRHPALLAQEIATIDTLSDGRFDFGIGAGWLKSEYDAAGLRPFCRRSSGSGRRPGNASIGSC